MADLDTSKVRSLMKREKKPKTYAGSNAGQSQEVKGVVKQKAAQKTSMAKNNWGPPPGGWGR